MTDRVKELDEIIAIATRELEEIRSNCKHGTSFEGNYALVLEPNKGKFEIKSESLVIDTETNEVEWYSSFKNPPLNKMMLGISGKTKQDSINQLLIDFLVMISYENDCDALFVRTEKEDTERLWNEVGNICHSMDSGFNLYPTTLEKLKQNYFITKIEN